MRTWKTPCRLAALACALALLAAACSSDSSDEPAQDATAEATAEATEAPIDEPTEEATESPTETPTEAPTEAPTETATPEESVHVELPDYPLYETTVITEDQELLDNLATTYAAGLEGEDPEMERFLFGTIPVEVFDTILSGQAGADMGSLLWLMHLSGYFGGRWLRGEIEAAQPDAPLVGFSQPPTEESFGETMDKTQLALDAATGSDEATLSYAADSLPNQPPEDEGGDEIPGLTDNFGYNQGYLLEILATPPEGIEANAIYGIECVGLFGCEYASPRLAALEELAPVQAKTVAGEEPYTELVAELLPLQETAIPRGQAVWSGGLSVEGFSQASYDQLLDVSSSYLEMVQATALTMSQATTEAKVDQARIGALADAAIIVWLDAYYAGLTNGEGEIVLPTFS